MKKQILNIAIIALVVCAIWQAYNIGKIHGADDISGQYADIADTSFSASVSDEFVGKYIDLKSLKVENHLGNEIAFDSLQSEFDLFARFSTTACRPCVDKLMSLLDRMADEKPGIKVAVLLDHIPNRDLLVSEKQYGDKLCFFKTNGLDIDFDNGETPYLFQTDRRGRIYSYIIFDQNDHLPLTRYLSGLK